MSTNESKETSLLYSTRTFGASIEFKQQRSWSDVALTIRAPFSEGLVSQLYPAMNLLDDFEARKRSLLVILLERSKATLTEPHRLYNFRNAKVVSQDWRTSF